MNVPSRLLAGSLLAAGLTAALVSGALAKNSTAVLQTTMGTMTVELFDGAAPKTVANFKALARKGFYDGVKFHRVIKGFMVQTGDPNTKSGDPSTWGTGNSGSFVPDEFSTTLHHTKGILSMANSGSPNSQSSQFFIMLGPAPHLDGHYSIFGRVTRGMDVLDKIGNVATRPNPVMPGEQSTPVRPPVLRKVVVKG